MKNTLILLLIGFSILTLTSNRSGRTNTTGQGATTAPGETGQYCGSIGCHFNGNFDPELKITLTDNLGNLVTNYIPNETYTVNMQIDHTGNPIGYGFQIVSLKDSDSTGINTWAGLTSQMQDVLANNRQYVEQRTIINNELIQLEWTAPEAETGPVSFYGVGNAVNGNGQSSGDGADTSFLRVVEDEMSSLYDLTNVNINLYPNPSNDYIRIEADKTFDRFEIYNSVGQQFILPSNNNMIDVSQLSSGLYFISIRFNDKQNSLTSFIVN